MNKTFEARVLDLLEASLEHPEDEQEAFLLAESEGDPKLRERLLSVLVSIRRPERAFARGAAAETHQALVLPERIGAYRVERVLGRGGMGIVVHGSRVDGDFSHEVAIKIVTQEVASDRLIQRLRAERRALARLRHPGITQLHDGGELDDGRPYIVMEYVADAMPLHRYLENDSSSLEERLALFERICDAVRYAHQNLVIHRDLSPGNILVTKDKQPKLIDFGIAHDLTLPEDAPDANVASLTRTPGYSAPEREVGESSTLTDIYSLGRILGDLVQGHVDGELDAIIGKATAFDASQRYTTVDALLDDVRAYEAGFPLSAIEKSPTYVLRKFSRRHWLAIVVTSVFVIGAALAALLQATQLRATRIAETQANERFMELRRLAGFMMFELHDLLDTSEANTGVRATVLQESLAYLEGLAASDVATTDLRLEVAAGLERLSEVTGNPRFGNLGLRDETDRIHERLESLLAQLYAEAPEDKDVAARYARVLLNIGAFENTANGDAEAAVAYADRVIDLAGQADLPTELASLLAADATALRAGAHLNIGEYDQAVLKFGQATAAYEAILKSKPDAYDLIMRLARETGNLAMAMSWKAYMDAGAGEARSTGAIYRPTVPVFDKAIAWARRAMDLEETTASRTLLAQVLKVRANTVCYIDGAEADGIRNIREAREVLGGSQSDNGMGQRSVEIRSDLLIMESTCFAEAGDYEQAVALSRVVLEQRKETLAASPENPEYLRSMLNSLWAVTAIYDLTGDKNGACQLAAETVEFAKQHTYVFEKNMRGVLETAGSNEYLEACSARQ